MPQTIAGSDVADRCVISRRVILKAAAAFTAMATAPKLGVGRTLAANDLADVQAGKWIEEESISTFSAAESETSQTTFEADFPFYSIAPHWGAEGPDDAIVQFQVSADGKTWSDTLTSTVDNHDAGQPDREGRHFGELIFLESSARFVRYEVTDAGGAPITLPALAFTYLNSSDGPTLSTFRAASLTPTTAPPPIISRAAWGANEKYLHEDQDLSEPIEWTPQYQTVEKVIIHHSATPNFQDPLSTVRSIYYYHAVERGWGDIGYNYLVDWQGNVYEGRVGGDDVIGGHAFEYAHGSSGICTIGNFMETLPTDEALAALIWITAWVGRKLDPWGSGSFHEQPDFPNIAGHRDCYSEDCPGDMLYLELDDIRQAVSETLTFATDPTSDPAFSVGDEVGVTVDATNLRAGPGTDFSVLTTISEGSSWTVLDGPVSNSGYTWYRISDDLAGWSVENNLEWWGSGSVNEFSSGDTVTVVTDVLNVRAAAGLSGSVVTRLYDGDTALILGGPTSKDGYSWYRLESDAGTGWAVSQYLSKSSSGGSGGGFGIGATVIVDTDSLRLRSSASTSASTIASMPNGTRLTIQAAPTEANGYTWYKVTGSYGTGWCAGDYLAPTSSSGGSDEGLAVGDTVKVIDGTLNLREGPSTSDRIIAGMADGTELEIEGGPATVGGLDWYRVTSSRYGDGWCVGDYLQEI
jgi:uncharacterized protein YgiM (DUF1202 family)